LQKWLMERDTKTEKKSKRIGTLPRSFYTPIDNGSRLSPTPCGGTHVEHIGELGEIEIRVMSNGVRL